MAEHTATAVPSSPPDRTVSPPPQVFVRPGGISYRWKFGTGTSPGYPGSYPVTSVGYYNVPAFNWVVTRGYFEYSADGENWTTYTLGTSPAYIANPANFWRFVDTSPANTTSANSFGTSWNLDGTPTSVQSGGTIYPDNAPTNILSDNAANAILDNAVAGDVAATLTPGDTGDTRGGFWEIEDQSVPGLFTLNYDSAVNNSAALALGAGALPPAGNTASVTLRYYDVYQTDSSGNPIPGEGVSETFTFTVVPEATSDLNFTADLPVNTYTDNVQSGASIATLSDGSFVVVWQSAGQDGKLLTPWVNSGVYGQRFSSTGARIGGEFVVASSSTEVDEASPVVTALDNGRFAVAYLFAESSYSVRFRIVEADGTVSSEFPASASSGNHYTPAITTLNDGSILIAWHHASGEIRVRQFSSANGAPLSAETTIGSSGSGPGIAGLSNGEYAITWADPDTYEIIARAGAGGADQNTGIPWTGYSPPSVASIGNGFVVASESYDYDSTFSHIDAARFDNSGALQGSVFRVNAGDATTLFGASVAGLSGGGFVITWTSEADDYHHRGVFGKRFTAAGAAVDDEPFQVNEHRSGDQANVSAAALSADRFAAVWTDIDADGDSNVEGRVLLPSNASPAVAADAAEVTVGEGATATNTGVFSDADGNGTVTVSASAGSVVVDANAGTWNWSLATADGPDDSRSVTVTATDGIATNTATFTLTVTNLAPATSGRVITIVENQSTNIVLEAFDPGLDGVDWVFTATPTNGSLSGVVPNLVYIPATNTPGADSFAVKAVDTDGGESASAVFSITILDVNHPPVAGADSVVRPNSTRIAKIPKASLLNNDSDPDSDPIALIAVGQATPPGATIAIAGNFVVYSAPATNAGDGSFAYTLSDGPGGHLVTNTVSVIEIAAAPVASGPNVTAIAQSGADYVLTFIGVPRRQYRVQFSASAGAPYVWTEFNPLAIYTTPTNGVFQHIDVDPQDSMRLYRAVAHP